MTAAPSTLRGGRVLAVLALANTAVYAARNSLFTVYPDLRERYGLHDAKLGLLTTAFLLPHALATLPFGWAGDRYDRRRVIAFGLALASLAGAAGALTHTLTQLVISRAIVGLGMAAVVPIANSILGQLFEGPNKASRMSIFNLGLLLGGVVGFGVGAIVGFPGVVVVIAVPGIVLAVVLMVLPVPEHPGARIDDARASMSLRLYLGSTFGEFWGQARELLRIRALRWLMFATAAMAFATGGYNAWLVDYLEREKHMSKGDATWLLSATMVGAIGGILTGARVADRLRRGRKNGRLWAIAFGMAMTIPCASFAIVLPPGPGLYVAGIATMFFISWYHAPMAVSVDDLAPAPRVAAAQGLVIFAMHFAGTAPSSYVVGLVSDYYNSLYDAMWVPTVGLVLATLATLAAMPSFAREARRDRLG